MRYVLPDDEREFVFSGGTWMQGNATDATEVVDVGLLMRLNEAFPSPQDVDAEQPAPDGETNAERFKRLAKARMARALKMIELIGNLSSRSSYEYTDTQIAKMRDALVGQMAATFAKFEKKAKDKPLFDFDEE